MELEEKIAYRFQDRGLFSRALTHSSYSNEKELGKNQCNERLEFLGDAVLELVSSEFLYENYPDKPEGEMTRLRAALVCEQALAEMAKTIGLGEYLLLGRGEEQNGGRKKPSLLSDGMEALIGAIYLDGGFETAKEWICKFLLTNLDGKKLFYDSKTALQEIVQADRLGTLTYEVIRESGPDHEREFEVQVFIGGKPKEKGVGHSKKAAQQQAAYQTLLTFQEIK